jgi:hypothetical protein
MGANLSRLVYVWKFLRSKWLRGGDLNPGPLGYERNLGNQAKKAEPVST